MSEGQTNPYESPHEASEKHDGSTEAVTCTLTESEQRRNMILFACCTGLQYLAAPVLYVGVTQASLCDHLGADDKLSNLPATFYFAMTAVPALIAWLFPYVSFLKRNLVACYSIVAAMLAIMSASLIIPLPNNVRIGFVIVQGAVAGMAMPAAIAFLWEVIGRGTDQSRRGFALSLAFGVGPMLAVVGSLGSQLLLSGELGGVTLEGLKYPLNFAVLFAAGVPAMALAAFLSSRFVVPLPKVDAVREPFSKVSGLCAGIGIGALALTFYYLEVAILGHGLLVVAGALFVHHFRDILSQRVLLLATIVTVLLYSGNTIPSNMNLYTSEVLGDLPEKYAGYQNTLRFAFKVVAGFLLGWILTKSNPKAGILLTGCIFIAAQVWAIFATGTAYLIAFGIYGAGELVGVYAPNYILSASRPSQLRRNMAFVTMLMAPAAPTGYLFGAISDYIRENNITAFGAASSPAFGFQASFAVCAAMMICGVVIAAFLLPYRPGLEQNASS
ncbi:MAG: hypothetical protein CMJ64_04425 [Planctomycetaceae bacterium]|nr:hypothetical protein [Planctomycetaceae bacterium]